VKEASRELELDERVHKRANLGGAHYDEDKPQAKIHEINAPSELDPKMIARICVSIAATCPAGMSDFGWKKFELFRTFLTAMTIAASASERASEIEQRFVCGSGSRIINVVKSHTPPV
jgi:hypothetical protein